MQLLITSSSIKMEGKKKTTEYKWSDTNLTGRLVLFELEWHETQKHNLQTPPAILITLQSDTETLFKFELPLSFDYQATEQFVAVSLFEGHYIGFHFDS